MIVNKMIIKKPILEELVGEYVVVIYQLNEDNTIGQAVKCNYDTKIYILDKDKDYSILGKSHWFKICKGILQ